MSSSFKISRNLLIKHVKYIFLKMYEIKINVREHERIKMSLSNTANEDLDTQLMQLKH